MNDEQHVSDLFPELALGTLDAAEESRARAHLAHCAACRQELAELEELTGRLALALPRKDPPPGLEGRLMGHLGARRALPRSVVPFFRHPAVSVAAMVLVLVLAAGNVSQWIRGAAAARTPVAPGFITVVLEGADFARGSYGTVVLDAHSYGGVLAMRGMPRLDAGHQYQLWLVRDEERRSGGVFSVDAYGYANLLIEVPRDFRGFTAIGISVEPAGGSPLPTGTRVASGRL